MTTISAVRQALATRLKTINGLRVSDYFPESVVPPMAIVGGPRISYNDDSQSDGYTFLVHVLAAEQTDRGAQLVLDAFCSSSGTQSISATISAEPTLGGVVQYALVRTLDDYGIHENQNMRYWGARFEIEAVVYR